MDNSSDEKGNNTTTEAVSSPVADQSPGPARRRFTRNAIAGGAVMLSLGNRAAWGATNCMSVATLNSFDPNANGGMGAFASLPGGRVEHDPDLARRIHDIAGPPDYLGKSIDGTDYTCVDPDDSTGVCYFEDMMCDGTPQRKASRLRWGRRQTDP